MHAVTSATAPQLLLSLVITVVSLLVVLKLPRFLTWVRATNKLPLSVMDAIAPALRYSTVFIGLLFLVLTLSIVFGSYDVISLYVPTVVSGSVIVIVTWFSYHAVKHVFAWLRPQKRAPTDIVYVIELVLRYSILLVGFAVLMLTLAAPLVGVDVLLSSIFDWFTEHSGQLAIILVSLIFVRVISRFLGAFFNDLKRRTTFQPKVVDLASAGTRTLIYLVVGLMVLSSSLTILGAEELLPLLSTVFSVLIGVGFSFAAAGALGNIIAGVVLSRWKPYDIGDRIEVGNDVYGDVMEFDILFTKIKTIKEEIISVPNLSVLTNKIVNYSSLGACVIHSKIAVAYDYDRRTVEDLLLDAAAMTPDILDEPKPFVLILELANFYVQYEINAYTDNPSGLAQIYSNLHKNVLDLFDKAQITLLTPNITMDSPFFWGMGKPVRREG
jgi:small-conductance mechanosensitive channel